MIYNDYFLECEKSIYQLFDEDINFESKPLNEDSPNIQETLETPATPATFSGEDNKSATTEEDQTMGDSTIDIFAECSEYMEETFNFYNEFTRELYLTEDYITKTISNTLYENMILEHYNYMKTGTYSIGILNESDYDKLLVFKQENLMSESLAKVQDVINSWINNIILACRRFYAKIVNEKAKRIYEKLKKVNNFKGFEINNSFGPDVYKKFQSGMDFLASLYEDSLKAASSSVIDKVIGSISIKEKVEIIGKKISEKINVDDLSPDEVKKFVYRTIFNFDKSKKSISEGIDAARGTWKIEDNNHEFKNLILHFISNNNSHFATIEKIAVFTKKFLNELKAAQKELENGKPKNEFERDVMSFANDSMQYMSSIFALIRKYLNALLSAIFHSLTLSTSSAIRVAQRIISNETDKDKA